MADALIHRHGGAEAQFADLLVAHLVVSLVLVLAVGGRDDLTAGHLVLYDGGDLVLGQVHPLIPDIVRLPRHHLCILYGEHKGTCGVADVEERALEVTFVEVLSV